MDTAGLLGLLIYVIIVLAIAYLVIWCIRYLVPQFAEPGRLIVGVIALIAILLKIAQFLGLAL